MKRKLYTALIVLLCLCSLTVLSACGPILDLIFGPETPPVGTHVHTMETKTYSGSVCSERGEITYYKCTECGKCYLDEEGTNEIDEDDLATGHAYVMHHDDEVHYRLCALCNVEEEGSRAKHSTNPDRYRYTSTQHYKLCDVCKVQYDKGTHDANSYCEICKRSGDYTNICNSRYGYTQLENEFENYANMQKLYKKIDAAVKSAHDDAGYDFDLIDIASGEKDYALSIGCSDCQVSPDEAFIVAAVYRSDNPLYYWLGSRVGLATGGDLAVSIKFCVDSNYRSGSARTAENVKIYYAIDDYLSDVSGETDPYFVALALHDKIIANIDYAYKADGVTAENESWAHGIVGVFDCKSAVCEGYAKAFQLLLNACNVNNAFVTGTSRNEGHAWNIVQLANDSWYWFDLTWDDQPNRTRGVIYDYFCVPNGNFENDHTVSSTKTGMNYQCNLPVVATEPYQTDGLELNETFDNGNFTYKLVGYNRLAVTKCLYVGEDGVATIPATVVNNGRTYKVKQINEEAFSPYSTDDSGLILVSPDVTKLVIPETVDIIYNKSLVNCKTLVEVEFVNNEGWSRYPLNGQKPSPQQVSDDDLSNAKKACTLLKQLLGGGLLSGYYVVWTNTAD